MSEHTPEPWAYDPVSNIVIGPNDYWVADLHDWGDAAVEEETKANGYLVAAAPELLTALEELMGWGKLLAAAGLEELNESMKSDPAWIEARASIAKAKGES